MLPNAEDVAAVVRALDEARAEVERLRFEAEKRGCWECPAKEHRAVQAEARLAKVREHWPHIEIGERGERRDPGPPTCLRCKIEELLAAQPEEPAWHYCSACARAHVGYITSACESAWHAAQPEEKP